MNRIFVELPQFRRYVDSLSNRVELLREIQISLLGNPEAGDVIIGTGGLRKLRHAGKGRGKSGGYRITYLYVPRAEKVYLFTIYSKNEKEDLTHKEKFELRQLIEIIKKEA